MPEGIPRADADGDLDDWISVATTDVRGKVFLSGLAKALAGTDADSAMTPADVAAAIAQFGGNVYVKALWFASINSGTSGTISAPTGGTIILDQWAAGVDALASNISGGLPDFTSPLTAGGAVITATLDSSGNWTLSGTPASYPVALIYVYKVAFANFNVDQSIGGLELTQGVMNSLATAANDFIIASGAGTFTKKTLAETKTILNLLLTQNSNAVGFTLAGGALTKTLTVSGDATVDQSVATTSSPVFSALKLTAGAGQGKMLVSDADGNLTFVTINNGIGKIGTPGGPGFGVGICPEANLPAGMTPMDGCYQLGHDNYGNYQFADGSIMVYIPKCYYRLHNWCENQIIAATKANPCQITQNAHGYVNGDVIFICNAGGMTQLNGLFYTVTKIDDNNYTIGVDSSAFGTFTSGGDTTKGFGAGFEFNKTILTYTTNSIEIRGTDYYATAAEAAVDGFVVFRADIDGGVEQPGEFVDKYKCSKNAWGAGHIASSLPNAKPLSSIAAHNPFSGLTGGVNYYYSAIDLAHRRDGVDGAVNANSNFFCCSRFIHAKLAMLTLAHAQACNTDTYCAWWNTTYPYPKGCNSNALKDSDDATVTYASDGYSNCGRTGSGVPFAKTTHNGQNCGIADINGLMYEISIGATCIATTAAIEAMTQENPCKVKWTGHGLSDGDFVMILAITQTDWSGAKDKIWQITKVDDDNFTIALNASAFATPYDAGTDPGTVTKGTFYTAKQATAMKSFTHGNLSATDHWGTTGVAAMMEAFTPSFKSGYAFAMRYGSGTKQVLAPAASGNGYALTGMGLPVSGDAVDATGTNLFGKDYVYQYIVNDMCLIASGTWSAGSAAGAWCALWSGSRANSYSSVGFRLACYPA